MATKGKGIVKKMMFTSQSQSQSQSQTQTQTQTQSQSKSRSMNGNEFVDLNTEDISIALEYTGSPVKNRSMLLKVLPVDVDSVPTANIISIDASPSPSAIFYNLSLPVVQPILNTKIHHLLIPDSVSTFPFTDHAHILDFKHHLHTSTSGTLSFSDTTSHGYGYGYGDGDGDLDLDFSQSSDSPLPLDCNQNHNHFGGIFCQEEELSDDEHLERNRRGIGNNKPPVSVTFRDHDQPLEESAYSYDGLQIQRPVPAPATVKPPKKGMCYHCHTGNRFTEKQACLVCDAKYCRRCIRKAMGSMPEGRKCLTCMGFPVQDSKRRKMLGKSSHILRAAFKFKEEEVKQIMEDELSCTTNQIPPEWILVNGTRLTFKELTLLQNCPNPPTKLKPGSYWYDKVSGLWGKEGHKPCQIITPNLTVGDQKINPKASNGNTNVVINNREITKVEQFVLKRAGVMCEGNPRFWLQADGTFRLEGMKKDMKDIWSKKRTKLLCTLLSLPSPQYPNPPRRKSNRAADDDGSLSSYLEKKSLCKLLLLGIDASGTSTIYKQARVLYDIPFSEEERRNIKFMIQSNLFEYLGRLLEGRELFEDEEQSLFTMNSQSTKLGPSGSDSIKELQDTNEYSISNKLKDFSDSLIDNTVSSKLDMIFQDFAPGVVEELWNDAAIQATYSRLHELQLPRAANYFLDKAVEIAKEDYEPSDTDIMYAKGITSSNGLATMEFSFPETQDNDDCGNTNNDLPDPITRYQLTRVHQKTLGQKCKWLDMFEDFGIVLFCVSLADYDEYDGCGLHTNKMLQSKRLFESVISHPAFKDKNFLLILNKFDLLEEKIEQVPLTCCEWFEDFNPVFSRHQSTRRGGNNIAPLAQRAFHYIGVKFKNVFKSLTGRKLYVCPVTGLESDSVDNAVRYAREIIRWDEDKLNYSSLDDFSCESIDNSSYS